jgi:hypothetical protein
MKMDAALVTTCDARRPQEEICHVSMQLGHFGYRVRIADKQMIKRVPGGLGCVFEADLTEADETTLADEASYELTPVKDDAPHTLLLVKSGYEVISNQGKSQPHFVDCNTWVGADGPGLMIQTGRHQSSSKNQLFRLLPGQSIFFIDSAKEVTRITAGEFGDEPTTARATAGEVADYVLGEAKTRGQDNPSTRAWCHYALQELGYQRHIDEFARMFPGFRRK